MSEIELQRVWREQLTTKEDKPNPPSLRTKKHKPRLRPSDERVTGVIEFMIEEYGFDASMDHAHIQMHGTTKKSPTTFGEDFWRRVIEELHKRGRVKHQTDNGAVRTPRSKKE
jgi:hypothetical protein